MPPVATSSRRPYVSRRKRRRISAFLSKISSKVTLGLLGLLLVTLVVSLGVIAFTLVRGNEPEDVAPVAVTAGPVAPTAPVEGAPAVTTSAVPAFEK